MSVEPDVPMPVHGALRRRATLAIFLVVLAAIAVALFMSDERDRIADERDRRERAWFAEWTSRHKGLKPSGGKYFAERLVLSVPVFAQNDPKWSEAPLGPSPTDTLGSAGCAVSSCAMILASYGVDTDPQRLNEFLTGNDGFTPEAWLKWEAAALLSPDKVRFVYEDDPSFQLIDENLERGNPVIIRLRYPSGITHFVVICGKDGYDYLIADPGRRHADGPYPLKEFGSDIEALRFYEAVR